MQEEQKSYMVVASKYELEVRDTSNKLGGYRRDGQKREIHGAKIIPRAWVEERNETENNEHYVIDEDATAKMVIEREKNLIRNAQKNQRDKATMADLVDVIAGGSKTTTKQAEPDVSKLELDQKDAEIESLRNELAKASEVKTETVSPPSQSETPDSTWSLNGLKSYCDDNGYKYHPSCKEERLLEIINENK